MRAGVRLGPFWMSSGGRRRRRRTRGRDVAFAVCLIGLLDALASGGWWTILGWTIVGLGVALLLLYLMGRRIERREAAAAAKDTPPPPRSPRVSRSGRSTRA